MPIRFKYQAAAVAPWSNQTTRRFGQSLVEQQRQQDFAKEQLGQQLGARDFQNATSSMSSSLQDLLDNNEITDEPTRRRILGLKGGLDTVMGSGFTDDQRRHYLNQYGQQVAGILANAPVKAKPTRDEELKGFLGSNYDKYKDQPWVPDGKGGFSIADIPQPEQPKLPEPPPPQPKTMEEDYNFGARKGAFRKDFNSLKQQMQEEADLVEGSPKVKDEDVLQRMQQDWEFEQKALGRQQPSAGALPAPTTGASTGGPQGNAWGAIAQANPNLPVWRTGEDTASTGRPFTYSSQPVVGDMRGAPAGQAQPVADRSGAFNFDKLAQEVAQNNALANLPYDDLRQAAQSQGVEVPPSSMTPEQIAALDAQTNSTMDSTNAQLAENQARAAEINAGYAPRTNSLKRQSDAMSNKTDRAESALRGELLPRSPQGERPKSMYDISDAKDKREAEQFAANQAEYGKYKARRDQGDAALQNPTEPNVNAIADPETMKQAARKFSSDYQIYKRGGGTLSTRDYIRQRVAQSTSPEDMSPDLIRQLENMYGMDLGSTSIQDVVEQDIQAPRAQAMADAKAKRDSEANRRKYARGMPVTQQTPAPAAVAPPDTTRPTRGLPGGYVPTAPAQKYVTPPAVPPTATLPAAAPASPKAPKVNFSERIANAEDDADRYLIGSLQGIYESQAPEIQDAIGVFTSPDSSPPEVAAALDQLIAAGIDMDQLAKPKKAKPKHGRGAPQVK